MPFLPKIDQTLLVDLPGERLLTTVKRVSPPDMAIVELSNQPLAKSHSYKKGDLVPVRRTPDMLGEKWEAISQGEMRRAEQARAAAIAKAKAKKGTKRAAASR